MGPKAEPLSRLVVALSLAGLVLCSEAIGWWAGMVGGLGAAVAILAIIAAAAAGALLVHTRQAARQAVAEQQRAAIAALQNALAGRSEQHRKLRHDLRGALSPALLTADRLLGNADPKVKRAGELMVMAVERASALMVDD